MCVNCVVHLRCRSYLQLSVHVKGHTSAFPKDQVSGMLSPMTAPSTPSATASSGLEADGMGAATISAVATDSNGLLAE